MMIGVLGLACLSFAPRAPPLLTAQSATQRLRFELIAQAPSQDFRAEASNMFNNVRTPAALVAGACFGAVFALQPTATDAPLVGLAKRIHMLIGVSAFSAELISVLVSSISLGSLGTRPRARILEESPPTCVHEFIEGAYELEWVTTQFNFLVGLLGLAAMVGIRAWVAFSCPLFGKIAVGFVASALLTMLSLPSSREMSGTARSAQWACGTFSSYSRRPFASAPCSPAWHWLSASPAPPFWWRPFTNSRVAFAAPCPVSDEDRACGSSFDRVLS